jgi:hypothetical protein
MIIIFIGLLSFFSFFLLNHTLNLQVHLPLLLDPEEKGAPLFRILSALKAKLWGGTIPEPAQIMGVMKNSKLHRQGSRACERAKFFFWLVLQ